MARGRKRERFALRGVVTISTDPGQPVVWRFADPERARRLIEQSVTSNGTTGPET